MKSHTATIYVRDDKPIMIAYQIVYANVFDEARLQQYAAAAQRLFGSHGARMIASGPGTTMEGDWPWQGAVLFEWPSREAALRVWNSDEYAAVRKLRDGAAAFQSIIVDGLLTAATPPTP